MVWMVVGKYVLGNVWENLPKRWGAGKVELTTATLSRNIIGHDPAGGQVYDFLECENCGFISPRKSDDGRPSRTCPCGEELPPTPFKWIDNDGLVQFELHEGQQRAWLSEKREIAMLSGTQGGKTAFGPLWLRREIENCGPGDYLVVTATYKLLDLKLLPEFMWLFKEKLDLGEYKEAKKVFLFHDGKTRVFFVSATAPESIESATAKAAWLDEAGQIQFRRDAWEAILRRLSLATKKKQGRILITTTLYTLGWLKTEIFDRWNRGDKNIDVIQFPSTMNPEFPKEAMDEARRKLPAWKFSMFYLGEFDKPAGLIYDSFDEAICKIPRKWKKPPPEWSCFVGHDFGAKNAAAMFYAVEPTTGLIYAYREYYPMKQSGEQRTIKEHVYELTKLSEGENIIKRMGGAPQEDEIRQGYTNAGWKIEQPEKLTGNADTQTKIQIERIYALHKENKIYVFDDLSLYLDQKMSYSYKIDDNTNEPTEKIDDRAKFHLMDCEKYILSSFDPQMAQKKRRFAIGRAY